MRLIFLFILIFIFSCTGKKQTNNVDKEIVINDAGTTILPEEDTAKRQIAVAKEQASDELFSPARPFRFEDLNSKEYTGSLQPPDFKNNPFADDQEYVDFISRGCEKNGINFGGRYTIIERGCGMMCLHIFIVDRSNGKIFTDIRPNSERYGYAYRKDSRLLIANAYLFNDSAYTRYEKTAGFDKPEYYEWKGKNFIML